jgi:hypothetical protein
MDEITARRVTHTATVPSVDGSPRCAGHEHAMTERDGLLVCPDVLDAYDKLGDVGTRAAELLAKAARIQMRSRPDWAGH